MSKKEDREVRFMRETCRWDEGDVKKGNVCGTMKGEKAGGGKGGVLVSTGGENRPEREREHGNRCKAGEKEEKHT